MRAPLLFVVVKRVLSALPVLAGVIVVTFALTRLLPGDPAAYFAGPADSQQAHAAPASHVPSTRDHGLGPRAYSGRDPRPSAR